MKNQVRERFHPSVNERGNTSSICIYWKDNVRKLCVYKYARVSRYTEYKRGFNVEV